MSNRKKKSWKKAPVTVKDYGQRQTNALLRQEFGEQCTTQDLETFQKKYGFYPFYIRKDPQYRVGHALYNIPGPEAPLSTYGPQGDGAKVVHKVNPDEGSVVVSDEQPVDVVEGDLATTDETLVRDARRRKLTNAPATAFKHDANFTAADIQTRIHQLQNEASHLATVPSKLKAFVGFGDYEIVKSIVASKDFHPVFTTGLSGIGKTLFWKQACAETGREYIRCNITTETDEDDLIGGFRLRNGSTYFELGPVVVAMIRGAVLMLDELDLASPKIMCLQPVLEGEPLTIKKLGITISPTRGFTIAATANTKGRGDEDGKFIGTGLLNEAFLERFPITIEQAFPTPDDEATILQKTFTASGGMLTPQMKKFTKTLADWAATVREAYKKNAADDVISTRRLCHIVRTFKIFGEEDPQNQGRAINYCLNRFDGNTKSQFLDLYNKHVKTDGPSNVGTASASPSGW
jgi:MoxR-like ATPase